MPITLPNLDDRRYADLIEEALAIIPAHASEWTNHNPSDPGITLVELFAYLTEMLIYRLNRVTVENVIAFLNLIDAGTRTPDQYRDRARLTDEVRKVVLELRKPYRAVTENDFDEVVTKNFSKEVARAFTTTLKRKRWFDEAGAAGVDFISVFLVPVSRSTVLVKKGEVYIYHSSDLRKPGNIAFPLVSEPEEYLYIGMESVFDAIRFHLDLTVPHYKLKFEYFKGDEMAEKPQWANLTEKEHRLADLTSNWASSGLVVFEPPADWKPSTVDKKLRYWVRVSAEKPATNKADATAFQVAVQSVPVLPLDDKSDQSLINRIKKDLNTRRLLATRVDVTGPSYKRVTVRNITLHLQPDALEADVLKTAKEEMSRFFHPLIGGRDGKGWPFGRDVYLSEIIERLVGLPGVDFVEHGENPLQIINPGTGQETPQTGNSISLERFELVDFRVTDSQSDRMFVTKPALDPHGWRETS
jgi:hypothetical protein